MENKVTPSSWIE